MGRAMWPRENVPDRGTATTPSPRALDWPPATIDCPHRLRVALAIDGHARSAQRVAHCRLCSETKTGPLFYPIVSQSRDEHHRRARQGGHLGEGVATSGGCFRGFREPVRSLHSGGGAPIARVFPGSGQRDQYGVDAYWTMAMTENSTFTPDLQLIAHPSFNPKVEFMAIPGIKYRVAF